jgi:hypothetical protein
MCKSLKNDEARKKKLPHIETAFCYSAWTLVL